MPPTSSRIQLLKEAAKRGVPTLMPYLWTLVFIIVMLSLVYFFDLDWWVAGFGVLVTVPFMVLLFLATQVIRSPQVEGKLPIRFMMWAVIVLFVVSASLFALSVFFGWPLNLRPTSRVVVAEDEGAKTIRKFYKLMDQGKFDGAWALIHPARKAEISQNIRNANEFKEAYTTTREHAHITIERVEGTTGLGLTYRVTFAVLDEFPFSYLYKSRDRLVGEWFGNGSMDKKRIVHIIMDDVKDAFIVPKTLEPELEPEIVKFFDRRLFASLFKPDFIFDIGRELNLKLKERPGRSGVPVWRFFIQRMELQEDGPGSWKIRRGLYPRTLEGIYEPGAAVP